MFIGDLNAKVGAEKTEPIVGPYGLGTSNELSTGFVEVS